MTLKTHLIRALAAIPLLLVVVLAPIAGAYVDQAAPSLLRSLPPVKLVDAKAFSLTLEFSADECVHRRGLRPLTLLSAPADLAIPRARASTEGCRV